MQHHFKPWLLPIVCLVFLTSATRIARAQEKISLVNSQELIEKGIKQHDKGEYKKALSYYKQVPEGDTNYMRALNEQVLSYLSDSGYTEAKQAALKALSQPGNLYRREFILYLGHAYDYLGKRDSALYCYDSLIRMNPYDNQPVFEKGATYFLAKDYNKAIFYFQRSLMLNPYHFRSHYLLGTALALKGRFTEAYLALCTSLFTTSDANSAQNAITTLSAIARQTDDMTAAYRNRKEAEINPEFDEIDAIIQSKLPLNSEYKFKSELAGDKVINNLHAVMEKLRYDSGDTNFAMQYYVPLFTQVYKNEFFDPFVLLMFSGYDIEVVEKLAKKKEAEIKEIQKYVFAYIDKIVNTQTLQYSQRKTAKEKYVFVPAKKTFVVGSLKSQDPFVFNEGPITMYKDGVLTTAGSYNSAGKKEGIWKFYYASGNLSSVENYKNDEHVGASTLYYNNGNLKDEYVFDNDGKKTEEKEYGYNGILKSTSKINGDDVKITLYHPEGTKEFTGTVRNESLLDGNYTYSYDDGTPSKEFSMVNGKTEGKYKEYYSNGKVSEEKNYRAGKKEGTYKSYYSNGNMHYRASYTDDKLDGRYEEFDENGNIITVGLYRAGKKGGTDSLFTKNRRFYGFIKYKSDVPVAYWFIDENGKVVGEDKQEQGLKKVTYYYPNGNKICEVNFKDGIEEGEARYYNTGGSLRRVVMYKEGKQHGLSTDYFKNGRVKSEVSYKEGEQDGYLKVYYASGILYYEGWVKEGKKQGIWKYYNAAGKLERQNHFVNDELNGPSPNYHDNGKTNYTDIYDHGMTIGMIQYDSTGREIAHESFPKGDGFYQLIFPNGKPNYTCSLKHGEYNGQYNRYMPNGLLFEKGFLKNGKRDSTYEVHSINGLFSNKGSYKNNMRQGLVKIYDEEGNLWKEQHYVNDELDGKEKIWEKGLLRYENNYRNTEKDSVQFIYGETGKIACVLLYDDGDLVGYTYVGKDGQLLPVTPVKNGTAKIVAYYPNGKTSAELEYKESVQHGQQLIYYSTGQKAEERNFDKSDLNGALKKWTVTGKLAFETVYKNDEYDAKEIGYDSKGQILYSINHIDGGTTHGTSVFYHPKTRKPMTVYYYYGQPIYVK